MLLPSESTPTELVGVYEVENPMKARALAVARRRDAKKRRELAKAGLTMAQAIERALGKRKRGAAS